MRFGKGTLGNVFFFLALIACYWVFNFCDGIERMYVYYPLSWTASRRLFGFPPHFRYFHLPTFADWHVDDPTWLAWKKISTANYEVPLYVQEGRWIPNAFKMLCVPAAVSKKFEDMVYAFTMEDFGKDMGDSVRKDFTVYGQYNELGYFYILSLLLNLCACLRNEQPERFCPNPCRAPDPCGNVSHTTGVCIPQRVKRTPDSIPPKLRGKLHDVYNQDFICGCLKGYEFNRTAKQCVPLRLGCSKTDCYNGGVCETLSFGDDSPSGMSYTCHCPPAWKGYLCEEPRNPCNLDHGLCHPYRCVRDPRNLVNGYACVCPTGTRSGGHLQPQCMNINECNFEANPCLNGGLCVDLDPNDIRSIARPQDHPVGYECYCRNGYSGPRCERAPPTVHWNSWSAWSNCSTSCGTGARTRHRSCSVPGRCVGNTVQIGRCVGPVFHCTDMMDEEEVIYHASGTKIVQRWGIGWTAGDDRELSDAYFWSETDDGPPDLYYRPVEPASLVDYSWNLLLRISQHWTVHQLMFLYGITLCFIGLPIIFIIYSVGKLILSFSQRNTMRSSVGSFVSE